MGESQTEMNAVTARTEEDEGSAWNMVGAERDSQGQYFSGNLQKQKAGEHDPGRGDGLFRLQGGHSLALGKEGRETEYMTAGAVSWGFWLERLDFTQGNKIPTQPQSGGCTYTLTHMHLRIKNPPLKSRGPSISRKET